MSEYNAPYHTALELSSVKNALNALPLRHDNYGLIHYDFEPDNVFYDQETNTCSVIDFDDGMYHWYALDIEQVFDSLAEEVNGRALQMAKKEFIRGYKTEHRYTEETENLRPLMRRFCNLFGYARLIRSVAEHFPNEPEWMVELRQKLDQSILNKESEMIRV